MRECFAAETAVAACCFLEVLCAFVVVAVSHRSRIPLRRYVRFVQATLTRKDPFTNYVHREGSG